MSTVGSILLDQQILLESGTNELELLVFRVADYTFGINVAKVREVLTLQPITRLAKAHPSVRGVFKLRNRVIPCVSLVDHLELKNATEDGERTMILTDFNQQQTAFLVDHVDRIHRLSWESILNVPPLMAMAHSPLTAVARCGDRLVVLLDFEMIIDQVTGFELDARETPNPHNIPRGEKKIIVADDSNTVREAMSKTLRASGYQHVNTFSNGEDAWREVQTRFAARRDYRDVADVIISDVEMPQMDGLHLTKCIKDHPELRNIPVMLYSSLITPDNHKKGKAVGADAQISKPQLNKVVTLADDLIRGIRDDVGVIMPNTPVTPTAAPPVSAPPTSETKTVTSTPSATAVKPATAAAPQRAEPTCGVAVALAPAPTTDTPFEQIDRQLWRTFVQEMQSNLVRISDLATAIEAGAADAAGLNELGRLLHSIKGAAMVVPLDAVARATHLLESLLEQLRQAPAPWSSKCFEQYADWLADLANPMGNPRDALGRVSPLECDITAELSKYAG